MSIGIVQRLIQSIKRELGCTSKPTKQLLTKKQSQKKLFIQMAINGAVKQFLYKTLKQCFVSPNYEKLHLDGDNITTVKKSLLVPTRKILGLTRNAK